MSLAQEHPFHLGALRVEPVLLTAAAGDRSSRLEPRVMRVLVALHRAGGAVVSRDELIAECWDGRIVTDDSIQRCIAALRRLADEFEPTPFDIETIPKVGYRLVGGERTEAEPAALPPAAPRPVRRDGLIMALIAVFMVAAAVAAGALGLRRGHSNLVEIAPFEVVGEDRSARALAEALPQALVSDLAGFGLSIRSRPAAPRRFGARAPAFLITGTVSTRPGLLRAQIRIEDGRTAEAVWSRAIEAPTDQPDQLRARAASEVGSAFTGPVRLFGQDKARSDHLAAKLRIVRNIEDDSLKALAEAERLVAATPEDPSALALYAQAAAAALNEVPRSQRVELWRRAQRVAARAASLDPDFGEAIAAQGLLIPSDHYAERLKLFRRGVRRAPESAAVQSGLADSLGAVGQLQEAARWRRRAAAGDPLSRGLSQGQVLAEADLDGEAVALARLNQVRERWPGEPAWDFVELFLAARFLNPRSLDRARTGLADFLAHDPRFARRLDLLSAAMTSRSPGAVDAFADNCFEPGVQRRAAHFCAYALASLDRHDESFRALEAFLEDSLDGPTSMQGIEERSPAPWSNSKAVVLYRSPFARMRQDPRMWRLFDRLGLVDFWRKSGEWPDFCRDREIPVDCQALARAAAAAR